MKENIFEQMIQNYANFTKSEKKIADYMIAHKKESQYLTITALSNECDVAVSTVSVFCRKLGLENFNNLKLKLAKAVLPASATPNDSSAFGEITEEDTIEQVMEKTYNLHQSAILQSFQLINPDEIIRAAAVMRAANQVICLGQGNHSIVAETTWSRFSTVSSNFKTVQDADLQIISVSTLTENDVVLYFSYTGATQHFLELAKIVKDRKAKLILITRFSNSPGAELADIVLLCGSDEQPLLFGSIAAIIAQLYLIDVLFNEYCKSSYTELSETRTFVVTALKRNLFS